MIIFRRTHDALIEAERQFSLSCSARADELREDLREARKEIRTLTRAILALKERGKELDPAALDERWPGGKYLQAEYETVDAEPTPTIPDGEAHDLEAELARDLALAFPDD